MSRREEIELKKARLAEMRRLREERLKDATEGAVRPGSRKKEEIDSLVNELLGRNASSGEPDTEGVSSRDSVSAGDADISQKSNTSLDQSVDSNLTTVRSDDANSTQAISESSMLSVAEPVVENKVILTYSKLVQTDPVDDIVEERVRQKILNELKDQRQNDEIVDPSPAKPAEPVESAVAPITVKSLDSVPDVALPQFLAQSARIIDRALHYDLLTDYSKAEDDGAPIAPTQVISLKTTLPRPESARALTSLAWSPKHKELLVTSYTGTAASVKGPVHLWNTALGISEYVLTCASDVLAVQFSQFQANLVFGSAYNGALVCWRLPESEPILESPLSQAAHTHPVFGFAMAGTIHASFLVSVSTDGAVCTWAPDVLAKPTDRLVLTNPELSRLDDISPTCVDISPRDLTKLLVGTQDGNLYYFSRFDQAGGKAGLADSRALVLRGHRAPVTAVQFHSSAGAIDFSDLALSCGLDWTIRLWRLSSDSQRTVLPVTTLSLSESIYDVQWSPYHPALFASVDGAGELCIWDLTVDQDVPVARVKPSSSSQYLAGPLNCLAWCPDGRHIAVGGLEGTTYVYTLDDSLTAVGDATWSQLETVLREF